MTEYPFQGCHTRLRDFREIHIASHAAFYGQTSPCVCGLFGVPAYSTFIFHKE